jgi:hypothetical protein
MSKRPMLPMFKRTQREKLYRNNAGIWRDKFCKFERLTSKYLKIKVNGNILIF